MEIKRIFDLLAYMEANHPEKPDVLAGKENGVWTRYSLAAYKENVTNLCYGLIALGIVKGDTVATICNNRPEWNFIDMAAMMIGAVHVPIYPTISDEDIAYILNHAEVKAIFVGDDNYRKIEKLLPRSCCLEHLYLFSTNKGAKSIEELLKLGKDNPLPELLEEMKAAVTTDQMATLIYTSGTTGNPKGVMLTHGNIISNFLAVSPIPKMTAENRSVSFLPLSHVYERIINYTYQHLGVSIYYVESMGTITENMKEVSPDMICAVPRFIEKVYDKILAAGRKQKGFKKNIFFWALNLGQRYELDGSNNAWYKLQLMIANKLVFSKWREALGGKLQLIVSGGAALQPRLSRVFWAAGICVHEGYGLTETSPVISVQTREPGGVKIGSVGPVLPNVTVKIADDQEILAKGPNVMIGYYKSPEITAEVLDKDGWFHTGDLGILDNDGHLSIVGRKKEIFKTSMGKYIHPARIENMMKESAFIDNIMVVGENQKYAAALVAPNFEHLRSWCRIKEIKYTSDDQMVREPMIKKRFVKEIEKFNSCLGATEQVKKIELMESEWTIPSGELTPSLKLRRNYITNKYKDLINKMFE
jgi:long-chain acyl-CoA synthetase